MSVGVMTDYKLKLRDLRASHTLGWLRFTEADAFFLIMNNEAEAGARGLYMSLGVIILEDY
jgi:hypothetical protein